MAAVKGYIAVTANNHQIGANVTLMLAGRHGAMSLDGGLNFDIDTNLILIDTHLGLDLHHYYS